jgi:dihydroxy-acid dehydratase
MSPRSRAPGRKPARGYARLYADSVLQPDKGCDFEFLRANALPSSPR